MCTSWGGFTRNGRFKRSRGSTLAALARHAMSVGIFPPGPEQGVIKKRGKTIGVKNKKTKKGVSVGRQIHCNAS